MRGDSFGLGGGVKGLTGATALLRVLLLPFLPQPRSLTPSVGLSGGAAQIAFLTLLPTVFSLENLFTRTPIVPVFIAQFGFIRAVPLHLSACTAFSNRHYHWRHT